MQKQDNTMMAIAKKRSRAKRNFLHPSLPRAFLPLSPFTHLDLGLGVVRGEGRAESRADTADAAGADDAAGDARRLVLGG